MHFNFKSNVFLNYNLMLGVLRFLIHPTFIPSFIPIILLFCVNYIYIQIHASKPIKYVY